MAPIRLLSEEVIGKIAAGEVVERPSAAIKELIENSLDAGASAITVEIRDGGITYFRVTDNGCGIAQNEIRMAFERHATSKIVSSKDLEAIGTLGFRGEALASIAAVGRVTLTTRQATDATGLKVQNNGGTIEKIEEMSCPKGTTIVVRDLFFNTPVRLKFLKKPATEGSFVSELIQHLILSRPDVSFRFINNERTIFHSVGDGQLSSAVHSVYGSQAMKSMRYVEGCSSGIVVKGYVGIGELGRGNRAQESFFINGRMMKSNLLSNAVELACRERIMIGKFPTCALHLTMPYDSVDVNVHPNKLEVRFRDEGAVSAAMTAIVSDALKERDALEKPVELKLTREENDRLTTPSKPAVPTVREEQKVSAELPAPRVNVSIGDTLPVLETKHAESKPPMPVPMIPKKEDISAGVPKQTERVAPVLREESPAIHVYRKPEPIPMEKKIEPEKTLPKPEAIHQRPAEIHAEQVPSFAEEARKPMRLIGSAFNTFILVEYDDHLLMIDQHAVHERLLFDRMMKLYETGTAGQEMLVPLVISVSQREQAVLEENRDLLNQMGLTVEPFGVNEVAIRSVPMILGRAQATDFVREVLAELESGRSPGFERKRAAILQMACKKAVKGGDPLREEDLRDLVESMIDKHVTPTCPHGRPLVVSLSHTELDKKFKRIQ